MSKFVFAKEVPAELQPGEFVIDKPNFIPEIIAQQAKAPRNGLTGKYHLRLIVDTIGQKYAPDATVEKPLTGWVIKSHMYEGLPFANNSDLNDVVVRALKNDYPQVFDKYLDYQIRNRPAGTKLVYFINSDLYSDPEAILYRNGLSEVADDKPRRTVGKPAVTKEQAEQLKSEQN
jgi:hypothetical protein